MQIDVGGKDELFRKRQTTSWLFVELYDTMVFYLITLYADKDGRGEFNSLSKLLTGFDCSNSKVKLHREWFSGSLFKLINYQIVMRAVTGRKRNTTKSCIKCRCILLKLFLLIKFFKGFVYREKKLFYRSLNIFYIFYGCFPNRFYFKILNS